METEKRGQPANLILDVVVVVVMVVINVVVVVVINVYMCLPIFIVLCVCIFLTVFNQNSKICILFAYIIVFKASLIMMYSIA